MWVAFDIETIPDQERTHIYYNEIKQYKPRGNIKDPEKIQKDIEAKRKADMEKAGLFWYTGKVICICTEDVMTGKKETFFEDKNEKKLLEDFQEFVRSSPNIELIGKSCTDFDFPFLKGRMLANDLDSIHKFASTPVNDIDKYFSLNRYGSQVSSLDTYAYGLGLDLKILHGEDVWPLFQQGEYEKIKEYCQHDTHIVAEIARKFYKTFIVNG